MQASNAGGSRWLMGPQRCMMLLRDVSNGLKHKSPRPGANEPTWKLEQRDMTSRLQKGPQLHRRQQTRAGVASHWCFVF